MTTDELLARLRETEKELPWRSCMRVKFWMWMFRRSTFRWVIGLPPVKSYIDRRRLRKLIARVSEAARQANKPTFPFFTKN